MNTSNHFALLATLITLFVIGCVVRHRLRERSLRKWRSMTPVIGSDLKLTKKLHERMLNHPPRSDWRDPVVMRAKVAAWRNAQKPDTPQRVPTNNHGGVLIDVLLFLVFAAALWLLCGVIGRYVVQTGSF